jgi:hypothetical protein
MRPLPVYGAGQRGKHVTVDFFAVHGYSPQPPVCPDVVKGQAPDRRLLCRFDSDRLRNTENAVRLHPLFCMRISAMAEPLQHFTLETVACRQALSAVKR